MNVESRVVAINKFRMRALVSDDVIVPITSLFDRDGEETEDWDEAVVFVCGAENRWFAEATSDLESVESH